MDDQSKSTTYRFLLGSFLLVVVAVVLILLSSKNQSLTVDEPHHLYGGLEWLQEGSNSVWPENPPFARIFVALGPYLHGHTLDFNLPDNLQIYDYFSASYDLSYFDKGEIANQLFWLRILILPFFLLSACMVWFWTRKIGSPVAAFFAMGMYVTLPPILAHSGLGTTDIAFVAVFMLMLFAFMHWLKKPSWKSSIYFGGTTGVCLLTKYSVFAFFPPIAISALFLFFFFDVRANQRSILSWLRSMIGHSLIVAIVAFLCVWSFYGFSIGTLGEQQIIRTIIEQGEISDKLTNIKVPAPEWVAGIRLLYYHNGVGHLSYALGEVSPKGFWYYYPMSVLLKTPWPFLIFFILGFIGIFRGGRSHWNWELILIMLTPFVVLISVMTSNINIGLRHILIIYPMAAIGAAVGINRLFQQSTFRSFNRYAFSSALLVWQMVIAVVNFPHYISYFNGFAGEEPGIFLIDSNLDWGQGLLALATFSEENDIDEINLHYFGVGRSCWYSLPKINSLTPNIPVKGWVAISEMAYWGPWVGTAKNDEECFIFNFKPTFENDRLVNSRFKWLEKYPLKAKIGGSIRIYYIE